MTEEGPLLERARAYDADALAELYDRYASRTYSYIYRRVSDPAVAEDLTSELFLRVLRSIRNERAWHGSFTAWLYRIAHNLVVDHYRRQPPMSVQPVDDSLAASNVDPAVTAEEGLAGERLRAAVGRLTPDQQEVLVLRFGESLTAAETGQIMEKSAGAVEALQHRALASLRRILGRKEV